MSQAPKSTPLAGFAKTAALAALMGALALPSFAGPMADFEAQMRAAYAPYRVALFATNANAPDKAMMALEKFTTQWAGVAAGAASAPQYADDPALPATLAAVSDKAAKAGDLVQAGDLAQAHETLEGIRDEIAALHLRNGVIGFSDRMNAYHAVMEEVLAVSPDQLDAGGMAQMAEHAGVMLYLAAEIAAHPAPEASAPEYAPLQAAFQTSVEGFAAAVRSGDAAAVAKAMAGLKPPYSKFFLAFG